MEDAEKKSPIVLQLERNTQSLIDLRESVSILETRLDVVLLPLPPQKENDEGKAESKEKSEVSRSLNVQNGTICGINNHVRELISRLEV